MKVAVSILMNNEAPRLEHLIKHLLFLDNNCVIYFWDDNSTDRSLEKIEGLMISQRIAPNVTKIPKKSSIAYKRNWIEVALKYFHYNYVLHIDADEQFDAHLLKDLTNILEKEDKALTYAFPRINLPNPNDSYPDHQVRLIKLCEEIKWKGKVHDTPHSIKHDKPVIKMYEEYNDEDYLYCNILQQFPILHHERRTDIKRDWW